MSIGAGGILGASLMLGWVLGTTAAAAQAPATGTWTDPPARSAAPASPPPGVASPAAPTPEQGPAPAKGRIGEVDQTRKVTRTPAAEAPVARREAERPAPSVVRHAARPERIRHVEPRAPKRVVAARHVRPIAPRLVERRETARPAPRRVVARAFAPRIDRDEPLPVGRVVGPGFGERNPIFADGDDRARRIAAAQAGGYLVVRARSVRFPDGRIMRSYRPYDEDGSD